MNKSLENTCDLYIKNYTLLKENFKWESSDIFYICAYIYTNKGMEVNSEKIKQCKDIIKKNTGLFSNFRGIPFMSMSTMLSLEQDPESVLSKSLQMYELLKKEFWDCVYLPIISFFLVDLKCENLNYKDIIYKAKEIYKQVQKKHPFLTSTDDYAFCIMFALKELSIETITSKIENCYLTLKNEIKGSYNSIQTLSFILALIEEDSKISCYRAITINNRLKEKKLKFDYGMELPCLGILANSADFENLDSIIEDILEVYELLEKTKGFGSFTMSKAQRLMYSSIIVSSKYEKTSLSEIKAANLTTINSVVIENIVAQQIAMYSAIMATSVITSSSSSD